MYVFVFSFFTPGYQDYWDGIWKKVRVFGKDRRNKCTGLDILFPLSCKAL
ncbi:hypothetical protein HanRHA438_Chr11g0518131 [Helianthus annuus]|nr:hypothetical protein HanIR_Chr11g0544111 [Helianthus annuus]KAJ0871937.1 hypothetical protein HanRHA438_Chr11g0518131 [Helianthus annuus]